MNLACFYDAETTGMIDFRARSDEPQQPHIVQLAAAMVDLDTHRKVQSINLIVKPDGWEIPQEASDVHGITQELATDVGILEVDALTLFLAMMCDNRLKNRFHNRITHNDNFDARIIRIACKRYLGNTIADAFRSGESYCTMRNATAICNLPPTERMLAAGRNHPKSPTLEEAYQFFTGRELIGAHDAMVDVDACIEVYFAIQDHKQHQEAKLC